MGSVPSLVLSHFIYDAKDLNAVSHASSVGVPSVLWRGYFSERVSSAFNS